MISSDSSAALATQIEQGAPADVFLSADAIEPAEARRRGLAVGEPSSSPPTSWRSSPRSTTRPASTAPADLAKDGVRIMAAGDEVPITKYATQLLEDRRRAGIPARVRGGVRREHRVEGGQRQGRRRQDRARRGRRRDRLRDRRQGLERCRADRRAGRRQRRRPTPASWSRPRRTRPAARASSSGCRGRTARRSSPVSDSCPRPETWTAVAAGTPARRHRGVGWGLAAGLLALFLGLPVVTLVLRALLDGMLAGGGGFGPVLAALALSLGTTAVSLVLTVAFGLPLAFVLARRQFRGKWLVEAIVDLPIVLPAAVAGLALLLVFGRRGLLGSVLEPAGIERRVHDRRRDPRPDVRVGTVLRPQRTGRDRRRRSATSRTPPGSTARRSGRCSGR